MSRFVEMTFCELPTTPHEFDEEKFRMGDSEQKKLYNESKIPRRKKTLSYEDVIDEDKMPNYARVVPENCMFIDFDDSTEAEEMYEIITQAKLNCLILETVKGYHFLFRKPDFYKKEMTRATNWFGYKFDCKGPGAVQIMRVCGMTREERCSWDITETVAPASLNIEKLDILPYWLWGKLSDKDLHKGGKTGDRSKDDATEYHLDDQPFTQLMKMREGGRHNHIVERCSYFGLSNGFEMDEFKSLITAIHDQYLVKIGDPMPDSDLFGDLDTRWSEYEGMLSSEGWDYEEKDRKWKKVKSKKDEKIDERRSAEYLFSQYDFYVKNQRADGTYENLFYRELDGDYNYQTDLTTIRGKLKGYSDQNFIERYFKEVEVQLMQICAENSKLIKRSNQYIITKNKILSCVVPDAYDFSWLGKRPPTDVVLPWNWYPEEWVDEHEEDLGGLITKFIKQLARNSSGKTDPEVEQWLYVVAGASMIPANQLEKIIVMAGGGQNGKSIFTSLIRLCLGDGMFNLSKIFDSSPQDSFWGAGLDKGILCVVDDMPRLYNRDAFSYIKGAITKTDVVVINEKFKPKKELTVLPQIIACTNHEFELYDKSEGMKRRVLMLPTEFRVPDELKNGDLEFELVLNTTDKVKIAEYKMQDGRDVGELVMHMHTREPGVLQSLNNGSLAWFANKARYMYFKWLFKEIKIGTSESMKEKLEGTFSGGFDAEILDFLEWYITERKENIWTRDLYSEYQDWHNEMATGEMMMKEKSFSMKLGKAVKTMQEKGYNVEMKKTLNDKRMSLNKLFIGDKKGEEDK
ncbi:MAG: hypothetical protein K2P14_10345 [Anaeroplasmataceae bacterium]|nr:hypothetical protein [Anaeroplasmataceae bacterium]